MAQFDPFDESYSEMQRDATNHARNDGEIVASIVRVLQEQKGVSTRKNLVEKLPGMLKDYGFDQQEVLGAKHRTSDGGVHNYLFTAMDYALTDMKNGKYGEDCIIELDGSEEKGIWKMGNPDSRDLAAIKEVASRSARSKSAKVERELIGKRLFEEFKMLPSEQQKALRSIGRDNIINYALKNKRSISQAFTELLK